MNMYKPVARVPDFPVMEREILRFWQEKRIFAKLRNKNAGGPRFSFLDGRLLPANSVDHTITSLKTAGERCFSLSWIFSSAEEFGSLSCPDLGRSTPKGQGPMYCDSFYLFFVLPHRIEANWAVSYSEFILR